MAQNVFSSINPTTTSGTQLATILNDFKDALMSGLSGTSRPAETTAGGAWIDTTNAGSPNFYWSYKIFDGTTNDIEIFRVNLNTLKASIPTTDSFLEIEKITADADGALLKFIKQRIANNGQVLTDDVVLDIQAVGRGSDSSNPIVARVRAIALDDMDGANAGATLVFEATPSGSTTIQEIFRIVDGKMGIGTDTPETVLDVEGATGIQSSRVEDSASPALLSVSKKRATGLGATQSADSIGRISHKTTDDVGAKNDVFQIESVATEAHTAANQGTRVLVKSTDDGAATPSTKVTIDSLGVETNVKHISNTLEENIADLATTATIAALNPSKQIIRMTGATATEIQGVDASQGSKTVTIHNASTAIVTISHENVGASAVNRMTLPNDADIALDPQSSIILFYSATDSRWKVKSSVGGTGGGGQAGKTYFEGGDFEANVNLASVYDDGGAYVDGAGGAPSVITVASNETTPLSGGKDLKITKAAADGSGEGVTLLSEAIDRADRGRSLFLSFEWDGTDAAYTDGDYKIHGYSNGTDATELPFVPISGFNNDGTLPNQKTKVYGYFITSENTDSTINVSIHLASDSDAASEITCYVDDAALKPEQLTPGAIITKWKNYTPTWVGATTDPVIGNGTIGGRWRRVGDSMEVQINITMGSTTTYGSGQWYFGLPAGYTVDTGKLPEGFGSTHTSLGTANAIDSGTSFKDAHVLYRDSTQVYVIQDGATSSWQSNSPFTWANTDALGIKFTLPIAEFNVGAMLSTNEAAHSTIKVKASTAATTVDNTTPIVVNGTTDDDKYGAYNSVTGVFTVREPGSVKVSARVRLSATAYVAGHVRELYVYKNGVQHTILDRSTTEAAGTFIYPLEGSVTVENLVPGDTLDIRCFSAQPTTCDGLASANNVSFEHLPTFSTFSVYGKAESKKDFSTAFTAYTGTAGQWVDIGSIELPPGKWDVKMQTLFQNNGAATAQTISIGFGETSGNVAPFNDYPAVDYMSHFISATTGDRVGIFISRDDYVNSSTVTLYAKAYVAASTTNVEYSYLISAKRIQ